MLPPKAQMRFVYFGLSGINIFRETNPGFRVMADDLGKSRRLTGGSGYFRCRPRVVASHKHFLTDA